MKKSKITFVALRDRKIVHKTIPIEHNFDVLPPTAFNGVEFPETPVETQVMELLYSYPKGNEILSDIMAKYDFSQIIDFYPTPERKKYDRDSEKREFAEYCKPILAQCPNMVVPFSAIVDKSQKVLFGHHKSNKTKYEEVLNGIDIALEASRGTMKVLFENLSNIMKRIE